MIATLNYLFRPACRTLFALVETVIFPIPGRVIAYTLLLISFGGHAASTNAALSKAIFAERAKTKFEATRALFEKNSKDTEAGINFGRACFDWAEFAANNKDRERIARLGIEACRAVIKHHSDSAGGHYYLAMNLGQLAQTKLIGALRLVDEMESTFKTARKLDAKYDFAGPERNLGLLYDQAPGWPTSIGNRNKARQHLEKAVFLHPDYPENQLNLIEAYLKWNEPEDAERILKTLLQRWPQAQKELTGEDWEPSWSDWTQRLRLAENKMAAWPRKPAKQ